MDEYDSSFETESDLGDIQQQNVNSEYSKRKIIEENDSGLFKKPREVNKHSSKFESNHHIPSSSLMIDEYSKEEKRRRVNFHSLDQYTRHKLLINYYRLTYPGARDQVFQRDNSNDKSDVQVLIENHKFIWSDESLQSNQLTWGQRVAKKYYDRLFKEYCIIDLSFYKQNKFGMRWRTEPEVVEGKGQFICGAKLCQEKQQLTSWEVLFGYVEHGNKESALVKVRLCPDCSTKLNYSRKHKKAKEKSKKSRKSTSKNDILIAETSIKEEIQSEDETLRTDKNSEEQNYEELIDKIWRQPVKLEQEDDVDDYNKSKEKRLENDLDQYLNEFFM